MLEPDSGSKELVLTQIHPDVEPNQVQEATGWELRIAGDLERTDPPTDDELAALRELLSR